MQAISLKKGSNGVLLAALTGRPADWVTGRLI